MLFILLKNVVFPLYRRFSLLTFVIVVISLFVALCVMKVGGLCR